MTRDLHKDVTAALGIGLLVLVLYSFLLSLACGYLFVRDEIRQELISDMRTVDERELVVAYGRTFERPREDYIALADYAMTRGNGQYSWVSMSFFYVTISCGVAGGLGATVIALILLFVLERKLERGTSISP